MNSGDFLEAFILKQLCSTIPMYFMGVASDESVLAYIKQQRFASLANRVKSGSVKLPGLEVASEMPQELVEGLPAAPEMQVLVRHESSTLRVPQSVLEKWGMHVVYGDQSGRWNKVKNPELRVRTPINIHAFTQQQTT